MVCAIHAHQFASLYELAGRKDLVEEFGGNDPEKGEKRSRNLKMLNTVFAEYAKNLKGDELMELLSKYGVPNGLVKTVNELLHDPHLRARNMVVDINHPKLGQVSTFNQPIKMKSVELGIATGENPLEPAAGEHNELILKKYLKMSDEDLARLRSAKAIWG
jgi:crotonobetainyl-CoA:carnitine CoA-transferase CaiB-like acyl-CoA transferase